MRVGVCPTNSLLPVRMLNYQVVDVVLSCVCVCSYCMCDFKSENSDKGYVILNLMSNCVCISYGVYIISCVYRLMWLPCCTFYYNWLVSEVYFTQYDFQGVDTFYYNWFVSWCSFYVIWLSRVDVFYNNRFVSGCLFYIIWLPGGIDTLITNNLFLYAHVDVHGARQAHRQAR